MDLYRYRASTYTVHSGHGTLRCNQGARLDRQRSRPSLQIRWTRRAHPTWRHGKLWPTAQRQPQLLAGCRREPELVFNLSITHTYLKIWYVTISRGAWDFKSLKCTDNLVLLQPPTVLQPLTSRLPRPPSQQVARPPPSNHR